VEDLTFVNRNSTNLNAVNQTETKSWVTFMHDNWQQHWWAITDTNGNHLDWNSDLIMGICRRRFGSVGIQFGIANTEQMLMGNAMRDNL
jgi:hypothetical protein